MKIDGKIRQVPRQLPHCPVLVLPEVIPAAFARELVAHWEAAEKEEGLVSARGRGATVDRDTKRRSDVWLTGTGLEEELKRYVAGRVIPAVQHVFNYRITRHDRFRIGCYEARDRGFFAAHRDNTTAATAHRDFAMSLNLNHGEYAGGRLRFPEFTSPPFDPGTGSAIVFSCSLLHEVLPVTRGRRLVALTFFHNEDAAGRLAHRLGGAEVPGEVPAA